jgi:hypothetical protein
VLLWKKRRQCEMFIFPMSAIVDGIEEIYDTSRASRPNLETTVVAGAFGTYGSARNCPDVNPHRLHFGRILLRVFSMRSRSLRLHIETYHDIISNFY